MRRSLHPRAQDRFDRIRSIPTPRSGRMGIMRHTSELPNIARIGALIGNPVRARFIGALMDGSERPALLRSSGGAAGRLDL